MIRDFITDMLENSGFELIIDAPTISAMVSDWGLPFEYLDRAYYIRKNERGQIKDAVAVAKYGWSELVILDEQSVICAVGEELEKLQAEFIATLTPDPQTEKINAYALQLSEANLKDLKKDKVYFQRHVENSKLTFEDYDKKFLFEETKRHKQYIGKLLGHIEAKDKERLKDLLHTGNKVSRKIFQAETDIKLGTTNKSTVAAIDSW